MSHRLNITAAALAILSLGCTADEVTNTEDTDIALGALEETDAVTDLAAMAGLAFVGDSGAAKPGGSPADRVAALSTFVQNGLACGQALPRDQTDDALKIVFSSECEWSGKVWEGDLVVTYTSDSDATIEYEGVSINGTTIAGLVHTRLLPDGSLQVAGARTLMVDDAGSAGKVVTSTVEAMFRWTEEALLIPSAALTRSGPLGKSQLVMKDIVWVSGAASPQSGTIAWTKGHRTWSVSFSIDPETGEPVLTMVRPDGKRLKHDVHHVKSNGADKPPAPPAPK